MSKTLTNIAAATAVAGALATASVAAAKDAGAERAVTLEEVSSVEMSITGVTDYGTSMADLLAGTVAPPAQGARLDIAFGGDTTGVLSGTMTGVDYANVRADGRFELNIHAEIVTPDGARIAYQATGVSVPGADGIAQVREVAKLTTSFEKYTWVNGLTFIAEGTVNTETGAISLKLYK
ncbi:MAG: DUF3237 family protein [Paracoccaceae bacterium]